MAMSEPNASPIELKFCCAAFNHTLAFNKSSHFGLKKYFNPSFDPGRVHPRITNINNTIYGNVA
jgi:hypothetical protein